MIRRILAVAAVLVGTGIVGCSEEEGTSELIQPSEWWRVYRLAEGTYALYEPNQFEEAISYLVLGSERGVLIDAGTGIGDIRQVVEELTDLPVSVVLTHEHYDHIGGAYRFDEIAAPSNPAGLEVLGRGRDNASLQGYLTDEYLWKPLPPGFDGATWTIPPVQPTLLLDDGDIIDLGGRTLEVIATPGHSPAHICLLDRENRLLWTGDHFFPGPLYAFGADVTVDTTIPGSRAT
jgi:glyoxylase-like metal-dependent hydrolase (beta-lactamase superfamily II)